MVDERELGQGTPRRGGVRAWWNAKGLVPAELDLFDQHLQALGRIVLQEARRNEWPGTVA